MQKCILFCLFSYSLYSNLILHILMNNKVTIIILGITGDLSKRKLIPAIYRLISDKKLNDFTVIGVGRRDVNKFEILENAKQYTSEINDNIWIKPGLIQTKDCNT